jgi:hypothetical protein
VSKENYYIPGSEKAIEYGCRCPRHQLPYHIDGKPMYWFNSDCPVHGQDKAQPKTISANHTEDVWVRGERHA